MLTPDATRLLRDIRAGRIQSSREAAERYEVSVVTIWRRVGQLRAAGYEIATMGVGGWRIIKGARA